MTQIRPLLARCALSSILLTTGGCVTLFGEQGNIYDLRREAQIAYAGNEDDRAEKLLLGLARAAPNEPETWFYLGNLYARTGRPEQAIQAYQKALMLNAGDARAWHNMGVVRLREAWAAFIQSYALVGTDDPLYARLEALIAGMEKLPLDGLQRKKPPAAPSATRATTPGPPAAGAAAIQEKK